MKNSVRFMLCMSIGWLLPQIASAQGVAGEIKGLQSVLDQLYNEMIGMSSSLIGVGRGIAGFGAIWYIAFRVWRHIANAEPVDFYPLLRPFAIGLAIMLFPSVLSIINGVMQPTVTGTVKMVEGSDKAIALLLKQKEEAVKNSDFWQMYIGDNGEGDQQQWYKYTHPGEDSPDWTDPLSKVTTEVQFAMSKAMYNFRNSVKEWMSTVLEVLFQAAALCINTIRTFQLIILAILGPLVLGISVFDGFHHSLNVWLARYVNVFLWLPVGNIFGAIIGKIQEQMIKLDLVQIGATGDTFFSSKDAAYLVFLLIGIVGYFTVPSVAGFIVNVGGGGALAQKVTNFSARATNSVASATGSVGSAALTGAGNIAKAPYNVYQGYSGQQSGQGLSGSIGRAAGFGGAYMADKISGNNQKD